LREHNVRSFIMMEKIFGCPHEEGIDYPVGESCPTLPILERKRPFCYVMISPNPYVRCQALRASVVEGVVSS
jgi:hypothetical protein